MPQSPIPVFDGHNDLLSRLARTAPEDPVAAFRDGTGGAIDAHSAQMGGLAGGFFAVWVPSPADLARILAQMSNPVYDLDLPEPIAQVPAMAVADQQIAILEALDAAGAVTLCRDTAAIRATMAAGGIAALLHLEGAEPIGPDLHELDALHARGLRSLGPVWSRPNIFGEGVPFRFPGNPDTGGGLTEAGHRLVRRCHELGILVDLSHLTAAGIRDVARIGGGPLVASHSCAHALCAHSRNLTDAQLDIIGESGGLVGVNFAVAFLRRDGQMLADTSLDPVLRHLDHLLRHLGENGVALGSDFDGATVPRDLTTASGLPLLTDAMERYGFGRKLVEKICHGNWLALLDRVWL